MIIASTREEAADLIGAFSTACGILSDRVAVRNALPHFIRDSIDEAELRR